MTIANDFRHITNTGVIDDDLCNAKGAAIACIFFMTESFCRASRQTNAAYDQKRKMNQPSVHHEVGAFGSSSAVSAIWDFHRRWPRPHQPQHQHQLSISPPVARQTLAHHLVLFARMRHHQSPVQCHHYQPQGYHYR